MQGWINNIKVEMSLNSCHKTKETLICNTCNKKVEKVYVLYLPNNKNLTKFACTKCFRKSFIEMFMDCDDDFINICSIENICYLSKETKKKIRSEMSLNKRYKILKRDNFRCVICGRRPPEVDLCVDHIKAVANGGTNEESNLRTLCNDCNSGKGVD